MTSVLRAAAGALLAGSFCIVAGCASGQRWGQVHGDSANSGQTWAATTPAKDGTFITGQTLALNFTSPVFSPDGTVFYSVSGKAGGSQSGLFRLSISGAVQVQSSNVSWGSTQLSSPAVDSAGFVYATRFIDKQGGSDLVIHPGDLMGGLQIHMNGKSLSPPKVLEVSGGRLIFLSYLRYAPFGQYLRIVSNVLNSGEHLTTPSRFPKVVLDQAVCAVYEGGLDLGFNFEVPGIELGPPFPEEPAVAVRAVPATGGATSLYVVVASNRCGVSFYRMDLADPATETPVLTTIKVLEIDASFSSPSIASDGTALISDSNRRTTAYDVTTGNEKWHFDADSYSGTTPTLPTLQIPSVFVTSSSQLTKLDLATGAVQAQVFLPVPAYSFVASAVFGGQYLFVSTASGLSTYDIDLKLLAFTPLAGGQSTPAIDAETGRVCVAATDGKFYVFPGF